MKQVVQGDKQKNLEGHQAWKRPSLLPQVFNAKW
jgi:hypothetical protein